MILIEVQIGNYLGEDDIVRYEDIYSEVKAIYFGMKALHDIKITLIGGSKKDLAQAKLLMS